MWAHSGFSLQRKIQSATNILETGAEEAFWVRVKRVAKTNRVIVVERQVTVLTPVWGVGQRVMVVRMRLGRFVREGIWLGQSVGRISHEGVGKGWIKGVVRWIQLHHRPLLGAFLTAWLTAAVHYPLHQFVHPWRILTARALQSHLDAHTKTYTQINTTEQVHLLCFIFAAHF